MSDAHVAHRHRLAIGRPEAAGGHHTDTIVLGIIELSPFADRRTPLGNQPHPLAGVILVGDLGQDDIGPREAAFTLAALTTHLAQRPDQAAFHRRGGGIEIVTVQAQPRLETQRVPRAKTDELHLLNRQQQTHETLCVGIGHGDLEAILAGIATAADPALDALDGDVGMMHEGQLAGLGRQTLHHRVSHRPLQCEQRPIIQHLKLDIHRQADPQMRDVLILAGSVHHHVEVITAIDDHQVIQDTAGVGGQQAIALHAHRQVDDIRRHQGLQRRLHILATQDQLPHVRDIEQPCLGARVFMLLLDAKRVLHGHGIAGELDHPGPLLDMQVMKGGLLETRHCGGIGHRHSPDWLAMTLRDGARTAHALWRLVVMGTAVRSPAGMGTALKSTADLNRAPCACTAQIR